MPERALRLRDGLRIYAIGDIHGHADLLQSLNRLIDADRQRAMPRFTIELYVGDYIDRGPRSRDVLDMLIGRQASVDADRHRIVCLRGNHEQALIDFLDSEAAFENWIAHGGLQSAESYRPGFHDELAASNTAPDAGAVRARLQEIVPLPHQAFLRSLPSSFTIDDYYFCHAGIDISRPLDRQRPHDLMTMREPFLSSAAFPGKIVVHGHTPVPRVEIRPHRINVDTGAFASAILSAIAIEEDKVRVIETDRTRLARPPAR